MAPKGDTQLETFIDQAFRRHDFDPLEEFLQKEPSSQKCSKQLTAKLHRLIVRELDRQEVKTVSTVLNVICKFGKYMTSNGEEWLSASLKQGVIEKIRNILAHGGKEKNDSLINLTEDFFDVVMVIHNHSNDGKIQVLENFIWLACSLLADTEIAIFIKQEVVRKLNTLLDKMPRDLRKKILCTDEVMTAMPAMGKQLLDAGDYDLQVAITEALCRMTSEKQRGEFACQCFHMEFVTNAFKAIKDSEFETDCRKFLNLVNGMLGDKRRVFTYPCLSAHLEDHKLSAPSDEKLEEFWIDFNVGSQSISFYVSEDGEDHQWETVCVPESDVSMYSVTEIENKKLLTITLNTPATVGRHEGSQIQIYFHSLFDIGDVTRRIFGANKCKAIPKNRTGSVAKAAVHIIFEESRSQVIVPESQESSFSTKYREACGGSEAKSHKRPHSTTSGLHEHSLVSDGQSDHSKLVTPSRSKISEASMINPSFATRTPTLPKGRVKPPLEMVRSSERCTVPISNKCDSRAGQKSEKLKSADNSEIRKVVEKVQSLSNEEKTDIVPDTQPVTRRDPPIVPGLAESYHREQEYSRDKRTMQPSAKCMKQMISVSKVFLSNRDVGVSDQIGKQQSFSSVSDGKRSPKEAINPISNQKTCQQAEPRKITTQGQSTIGHIEKGTGPAVSLNPSKCRRPNEMSRISDQSHVSPRKKGLSTDAEEAPSLLGPQPKVFPRSTEKDAQKAKQHEKEKAFKEATRSLISNIGCKYTKKPGEEHLLRNANSFTLHSNKVKQQNRSFNLRKPKEFGSNTKEHEDDVYSFHFRGSDEPIINLGVSSLSKETGVTPRCSEKSTDAKQKDTSRKPKTDPRKHLFSDTDTDRGVDDSKTDISWLRNTGSKTKPKIIGYGKQKQRKKAEEAAQHKLVDASKSIPKERKNKACKEPRDRNLNRKNKRYEAEKGEKTRPQREAVTKKNYKELSDSGPESEGDGCQAAAKSDPVEKQKKPENVGKLPKRPQKTETKTAKQKKTTTASPKPESLPTSPASIEQNRSERYTLDNELTAEHYTMAKSLSPSPNVSSPEKVTPEVPKITPAPKFYPSGVDRSNQWAKCMDKSLSTHGKEKATKDITGNKSSSPSSSIASLRALSNQTPDQPVTGGMNKELSSTEEAEQENCELPKSTSTPGSDKQVAKSALTKETRIQDNNPVSGQPDGSRRRSSCEMRNLNNHKSGPTACGSTSNLKRVYNDCEDIKPIWSEEQIKRRKGKLLPRKLFPPTDDRESLSTVSGNDVFAVGGDTWEGDGPDVSTMCQQISKEFTRKIQNRSRKMDYFTKQSLKSTQKHLTSLSVQVKECRINHLDKFQGAIMEEIENFEKDSQALKAMEKEFTNFWTQQMQTFSLYQKNEQRRIRNLRSSLENNVSHSIDFEENVFNSEMAQLKDSMKLVQERLLKEMQEEELLSVRRGLQSLFMAGARTF